MGKAYFNEANVFAGFLLFRLPLRLCNRKPENVFNRHGWLAVICQRVPFYPLRYLATSHRPSISFQAAF